MPLVAPDPPFLAAGRTDEVAAIILGAPLDATESFHSGTREAPRRIRAVSDVLETFSPTLGSDLAQLGLVDWGDVSCGQDVDAALAAIADAIEDACGHGLPLLIGGEHTATLGAVRGALRRHPGLQVIQIDAHADLRDQYDGLRTSHATVMRRIADAVGLDRICQYGIRSGISEEFELARSCLHSGADLVLTRQVRDRIHTRPVYLTIDIDVLDPSCAPGTGCPEPGGPNFRELLSFLYSLQDLRVIGVDVMEVLPAADVNDITSIAAAKLLREAALLFASPKSKAQSPKSRATPDV